MSFDLQNTFQLFVFTLVVLGASVPKAAACFMTTIGPVPINNPDEVMETAYFIGIAKVLSMSELEGESDDGAWLVEPLHAYKASADYEPKQITAIGTRIHGMCDTNSYLKPDEYMEVIIFRENTMWGNETYEFTITTQSLGKERWAALRKKARWPKWLKSEQRKCLEESKKWTATDMKAERTLNFRCY